MIDYAKSKNKQGYQLTLEQHSYDIESAALKIFDESSNFFTQWCDFFKLSEEERKVFLFNLRVSCLFHDIGKANIDFQNMVNYQSKNQSQTMRHEHISLIVMVQCGFYKLDNPLLKVNEIISAVGSHHIKLSELSGHSYEILSCKRNLPVDLHPDTIKIILERINDLLSSNLSFSLNSISKNEWKVSARLLKEIAGKTSSSNFLSALKAAVVFCDSIASIVRSKGNSVYDMDSWINNTFKKEIIDKKFIYDQIIDPYIQRSKQFQWHSFQEKIDDESSRLLMIAPCGFGKSIASLRWAANQADKFKKENLIFLLPTRGTATEIYKSYMMPAPTMNKILKHGTDKYSLLQIEKYDDDLVDDKLEEIKERYDALEIYSNKIFTATIDQFFSFLANNYGGICLLPLLANSILIIDEVHAFDDKMFSYLIEFIKHYELPILCMSATIPPARLKELKEAGLSLYEGKDSERDSKEKYHLQYLDSFSKIDLNMADDYNKVLIVVNTVKQCQDVFEMLKGSKTHHVMCYHSKFTLKDREKRHREVIDKFDSNERIIVVCTQVCEMSLDIDCDLLITQLAPWPSLVQRFGRCNRKNKLESGKIIVFQNNVDGNRNIMPYDYADISFSNEQLTKNVIKTQGQLNDILTKQTSAKNKQSIMDEKHFIKQSFYSSKGSFRDDDNTKTFECIIEDDEQEVLELIQNKKVYNGYVIQVSESDLKKIISSERNGLKVIGGNYYSSYIGLMAR